MVGWDTTGLIMIVIYVVGILIFLPFGVGPAILGWAFFMAPGLGLIYLGATEGKPFYLISGIVIFLIGAIPTYIDIKDELKK